MKQYLYLTLRERPEIKESAAEWFHSKWGVPSEAYLECMEDYLSGKTEYGWYLCLDGDKIIGTSGMSFVEKPPYFGCPSGRIGLLSSMFTNPAYRRKGIAKELLERVMKEAKAYGCGTVQITASDMGVLLYTDFGFVKNGNFMQYKL